MGLLKGNRVTALQEFPLTGKARFLLHIYLKKCWEPKAAGCGGIVPISQVTGGSPPEERGARGVCGVCEESWQSKGVAEGIPWFLISSHSTYL